MSNPVIEAIEKGHYAHWTKKISIAKQNDEVPGLCQACHVPYPCPTVLRAQTEVRRGDIQRQRKSDASMRPS